MENLSILGSTGSVGKSTLDVVLRHPEKFQVYALTAHSQVELLAQQCVACKPRYAVIGDADSAAQLEKLLREKKLSTEVLYGAEALVQVASNADCDVVMAAIVGAAGLAPTLAAAHAAKKVLLANKESLVMAGHLFMDAVAHAGAVLLPIDSEHNAMFQCMDKIGYGQSLADLGVERILLTGSGGPFRLTPLSDLASVSPAMACAHPNWSMGQKISVDSATMMNKGLELIEACWLFDTSPAFIDVVIHPQSIIHSMVQFKDGSTLAQMGNPDMRTPIAHALAWPERISAGVAALNIFDIARLDFQRPDEARFPCLRLAREAFLQGGTAPAILNAANEIAVAAFLEGKISYLDIARVNEEALSRLASVAALDIATVIAVDIQARQIAQGLLHANG